ncbi:MAG: polysaccharide deacetylase [Selenomonadaceae bacterium]|nr:polysaccharide deacetylase [Selenomonadaceae bacterium]
MKKFFITMVILAVFSISGYTNQEVMNENVFAKSARVLDEINPSRNANYLLADENFSNLQINEIDKPIYDKYSIEDREKLGLKITLPEIAPYKQEKVAYLTFDDGPDDKVTPQILDILKRENVKATFFVLGNMVEQNPKVLQRIFKEGHAIGNHSYNHVYSELYKSPWDFIAQFEKTDEIIKKYTGVRPLIIRAPGGTAGVFNNDYWNMVDASGYVEYDWNICTEDATASVPNASTQVNNVKKQIGDYPPRTLIILMHSKAGKEETAKALPEMIHMLRNLGYKFGVVTPMTPQPW